MLRVYRPFPSLGPGVPCCEWCCVSCQAFSVFCVDLEERWAEGLRLTQVLVCSLHCGAAPPRPHCARGHRLLRWAPALSSVPRLPPITCSLSASPCCLERLAFRRLHGAEGESFPSLWCRDAAGTGQLQWPGRSRVLRCQPLAPLWRTGRLLLV